MSLVTPTQLRDVLQVSSSLYSDAYLQKVIDTSELVILPLLVSYSSAVTDRGIRDNVATLVVAIGDATFDGTKTVTRVPSPYEFSYAKTNADIDRNAVIPHGTTYLTGYDAATIYASNPAVYEAIIVVSV